MHTMTMLNRCTQVNAGYLPILNLFWVKEIIALMSKKLVFCDCMYIHIKVSVQKRYYFISVKYIDQHKNINKHFVVSHKASSFVIMLIQYRDIFRITEPEQIFNGKIFIISDY